MSRQSASSSAPLLAIEQSSTLVDDCRRSATFAISSTRSTQVILCRRVSRQDSLSVARSTVARRGAVDLVSCRRGVASRAAVALAVAPELIFGRVGVVLAMSRTMSLSRWTCSVRRTRVVRCRRWLVVVQEKWCRGMNLPFPGNESGHWGIDSFGFVCSLSRVAAVGWIQVLPSRRATSS